MSIKKIVKVPVIITKTQIYLVYYLYDKEKHKILTFDIWYFCLKTWLKPSFDYQNSFQLIFCRSSNWLIVATLLLFLLFFGSFFKNAKKRKNCGESEIWERTNTRKTESRRRRELASSNIWTVFDLHHCVFLTWPPPVHTGNLAHTCLSVHGSAVYSSPSNRICVLHPDHLTRPPVICLNLLLQEANRVLLCPGSFPLHQSTLDSMQHLSPFINSAYRKLCHCG